MSVFLSAVLLSLCTHWLLLPIGVSTNLCSDNLDDENEALSKFVHKSSTPSGGVDAGEYIKVTQKVPIQKCFSLCCECDACNVAFFHQDICYLLVCDPTYPAQDGCQPKLREGDKFAETYMIDVRSIEETLPLVASGKDKCETTETTANHDVNSVFECSPDTQEEDCGENEECTFVMADERVKYGCECVTGFVMDPITLVCHKKRPSDMSCVDGLMQCFTHEKCRRISTHVRVGTCDCLPSYARHPLSKWCIPEDISLDTTPFGLSLPAGHTSDQPTNSKPSDIKKNTLGSDTKSSPSHTTLTTTVKPDVEIQKESTTKQPSSLAADSPEKVPVFPSTSTPVLQPVFVSAGQNQVIQLPQDEATLSAVLMENGKSIQPSDDFHYQWSLIIHPDGENAGEMNGLNAAILHLSELAEGLYAFKVTVTAEGQYGEAFVNVTVQPAARDNKPPVAIIKPASQKVDQTNDVVLDGSESTDDDKIVSYHWAETSGPVDSHSISEDDLTKQTMVLAGLPPGAYRFKLTVTDSDGMENSTMANVTIIKETDYPPTANAGSNVITSLPQNSVTLYGNASTDDKAIASYEWIKKADDHDSTADMTGVRTPVLHLQNLEVGDYTFTLKVTDTAGQSATADVHVFVKPEHNKPPVANSGSDRTVQGPVEILALDGANSTDDEKIVSYKWKQTSGPTTVVIENSDRAVATVSHLQVGVYKFKLTVADEEDLQSTSTVKIKVIQNVNEAPKADAGGDRQINLPAPLVILDGSKSSDDKAIVSYSWTRDDHSLAAGVIVNNSAQQAVLQMTNLVSGRYIFTLEVKDAEGLSSKDTASIIIKDDEHQMELVELELDVDISSFTQADQNNLENQISLLLHRQSTAGDVRIHVEDLQKDRPTGHLIVVFYTNVGSGEDSHIQSAAETVHTLKSKLDLNRVYDYAVVRIDTVVCQNNCSGHGVCDQNTKQCFCEAFWMQNFFTANLGSKHSNCDWSILYVIVITFLIVVTLAGTMWAVICFCRRYKSRPKKRHRYTLLEELEEDVDKLAIVPKGKRQVSSLMVSESDFSSEEETLFINTKKMNGHSNKNGLVKQKSRIKT